MTAPQAHDDGGADDERLGARARELFAKEHAALLEATPQSRRLFERATRSHCPSA